MMFKNRFSLYLATFLIIGFFFLALPEKGYSGVVMLDIACCQLEEGCLNVNTSDEIECLSVGVQFLLNESCNEETGFCSGSQVNTPIPTLSQWGLIAMAGVLGIIGFLVIRRRKVAA